MNRIKGIFYRMDLMEYGILNCAIYMYISIASFMKILHVKQ